MSGSRFVGYYREVCHEREELVRLAAEESVVGQELERAHCRPFGVGRADDRTRWELAVQEHRLLGHDQVGLEVLATERRGVEVREHQPVRWSVSGGALPALSCQVWKCIVSVGPMLRRTRSTSGSLTRRANDG
jgi:hypothetical protein